MALKPADDIRVIRSFLDDYNLKAKVVVERCFVADQSFAVFALDLLPGGKIATIRKLMPELSERLSNLRMAKTPARLRTLPLGIEVPHPDPKPLLPTRDDLNQAEYMMLLAKGFGYEGAKNLTIDVREMEHALLAGTTGSGKSTLLRLMLATLCWSTSPRHLGMVLVDLKNDDLTPFRELPHVVAAAYKKTQANYVLRMVDAEKNRRIEEGSGGSPLGAQQLVVVIDELAELATDKEAMAILASILGVGRSLGIHVIAATQKPLASVIGSITKGNFTMRVVLRVLSAEDAKVATGLAGTGAEYLPGNGAMIMVHGGEVERFQVYYIDELNAATRRAYHQRWPNALPTALPAPSCEDEEGIVIDVMPSSMQLPQFVVAKEQNHESHHRN